MEGGTLSVVGGYFAAWGEQDRGVCSWIGAASCSGLLLMFLFREVGVEIFTRLLPGHSISGTKDRGECALVGRKSPNPRGRG